MALSSNSSSTKIEQEDEENEEEEATILLEPHKANNLESRWLDEIGQSLLSGPTHASKTQLENTFGNQYSATKISSNGLYSSTPSNKMSLARTDDDRHEIDDEKERRNLREAWTRFTKYFNGHNALEKIPVREEGFLEPVETGDKHDDEKKQREKNEMRSSDHRTEGFDRDRNVQDGEDGIENTMTKDGRDDTGHSLRRDHDHEGKGERGPAAEGRLREGDEDKELLMQLPLATRLKMIKAKSSKSRLKRKDVWRWINEMERAGYLVVVRHW